MANQILQTFQTEVSMTVTNLHSLASSATAGWMSASVSNATGYINANISIHIPAVNTAPGNDKAIYVFMYASTDNAIFTTSGSGAPTGSEGAITFPSISTLPIVMPMLGVIPYPVQNKALDASFQTLSCFRTLPQWWGLCIINFSGFTFAASGNTVKYMLDNTTVN
jgi:hypothetical protein